MRRRVWKSVDVEQTEDAFAVTLDGRRIRTPAKAELAVPTRAMADAIAAEWDGVEDVLDPATMHVTRAANSATDKVTPQKDDVARMLAAYGETDLICYRAEGPDALVARQSASWDPWIDWSRTSLKAPLIPCVGIVHQDQPAESVSTLHAIVSAYDPFRLTGLHDLVSLSGSLILGLAVARGALEWERAWELSRLDETWQQELWGEDEDAAAAALSSRADFQAAHRFLALLDD